MWPRDTVFFQNWRMNCTRLAMVVMIALALSCNQSSSEHSNTIQTSDTSINFDQRLIGTGTPTIIFEAGLGDGNEHWTTLQDSLSKSYTTLSYDRLGVGESPATTLPRTVENQVEDLHQLITQNSIDGPIILVGHSMGSYIVRKYQSTYPDDIAGIFLIDPSHEYQHDEIRSRMSMQEVDSMKAAMESFFSEQPEGVYNEYLEFEATWIKMREVPFPKDIPVHIVASWRENSFLTPENMAAKKKLYNNWLMGHENITMTSTTKSGHYIHLDEPGLVLELIRDFLSDVDLSLAP